MEHEVQQRLDAITAMAAGLATTMQKLTVQFEQLAATMRQFTDMLTEEHS